mmetsp:Transcript_72914/g.159353  ORF Transcript_72914/g.159353 Transcript_72914/m.159353 type:complete len:230 (+) Transcript_72914:422-1111(+)
MSRAETGKGKAFLISIRGPDNSVVQRFRLPGQSNHAQDAESHKNDQQHEQVDPPIVFVDVISLQHLGSALDIVELDEQEQVHAPLQWADVLQPTHEGRDQIHLDEKSCEEDLRHKEGRGSFHGLLGVGNHATHHQGCGSSTHGDQSCGTPSSDEISLETHEPVGDEPDHEVLEDQEGQLDSSFAQKVRGRTVHVGSLLAHENWPLNGECEEQGLSRAEHRCDAQGRQGS